ncbi:TPA: ABC transporter ATP-binding protein [Streptococcus suis]|uniref:ABC transporter ATP-binding protein n=1 Tax=Streptococcus suis TaxID=1307 RepID=UPI002AAD4483|nr:ABC transporter ATP-binding protein [Streptococcus suis]HEM5264790.1 ABC transporter ATP-binding protein [Streptococcus suis]HEM5300226.1 ABC transporter ATP-binding protein [Streptococcus suis]HEP1825844.1 ABC transporter ATP-binding protein [Streptococcus suis]HEP1841114.1 ABC transporter ATP-binding protein [Streptococcus suis]
MVVEVNGIQKTIGSKSIINNVSIKIERGQVFALLGPNGAGKTTLIRIILGLLHPDKGTVKLFDMILTENSRTELLQRIGVQNDGNLYENLTVQENLAIWGEIYGMDNSQIDSRISILKKLFRLEQYLDMVVGSLSKGNRQKVMLARAMLHNPEVLILDEPTTGLDPEAIDEFYSFIKQLKKEGITIIMCTHYLYGMDGVVDSIGILKNGCILQSGDLDALQKTEKIVQFQGHFHPNDLEELSYLGAILKCSNTEFHIKVDRLDNIPEIVKKLSVKENAIYGIHQETESLKDIYFRIVGGTHHEELSN